MSFNFIEYVGKFFFHTAFHGEFVHCFKNEIVNICFDARMHLLNTCFSLHRRRCRICEGKCVRVHYTLFAHQTSETTQQYRINFHPCAVKSLSIIPTLIVQIT